MAAQPEQAKAALEGMLALAHAGDWATYVDRYYGEAHKLKTPADREQLVQRFRDKWAAQVVAGLEHAVDAQPVVQGDVATFSVDGVTSLTLYRSADGQWGFHL